MEHVVVAATSGRVDSVAVAPGAAVQTGDVLAVMTESAGTGRGRRSRPRPRRAHPTRCAPSWPSSWPGWRRRPTRVGRRRRSGATPAAGARPGRTSRTCATRAASRSTAGWSSRRSGPGAASTTWSPTRRPTGWSPASAGSTGSCSATAARCAVLSYDYTVLAGTQGQMNHRKKDRLFDLAERLRLPVVLFAEGGGGRPGDTDHAVVTGLDTEAFARFGALSGRVPLVGVVSGRCFAGNAALLGCCHVIIATPDANIGMGGPAMIEGGGLGVFAPEEVGPVAVQVANGVVDVLCDDERQAVDGGPPLPLLLPGRSAHLGRRPTRSSCARWCPGTGAGSTTCTGPSSCWSTRVRSSSCGRASPPAWSPRWPGWRGGPSASWPTTRCTRPAPSTGPTPTRRPGSSSCARPSGSPWSPWSTPPASWWGPRRRRRRSCAT